MASFQYTEFLLGLVVLIPLAILFVFVLRWKKKVKNQIGDEELVNTLTSDYAANYYNYKFLFILLALALGIIGAANMRTPTQGSTGNRTGVDVMVALDVS